MQSRRFQIYPDERRFRTVPFSVVFGAQFIPISVNGRPNRKNKVAFTVDNLSGVVWTEPEFCFTHVPKCASGN